jgi:hypothetical protein
MSGTSDMLIWCLYTVLDIVRSCSSAGLQIHSSMVHVIVLLQGSVKILLHDRVSSTAHITALPSANAHLLSNTQAHPAVAHASAAQAWLMCINNVTLSGHELTLARSTTEYTGLCQTVMHLGGQSVLVTLHELRHCCCPAIRCITLHHEAHTACHMHGGTLWQQQLLIAVDLL